MTNGLGPVSLAVATKRSWSLSSRCTTYNLRFKSTNTMGDAKRFIGIDLIRDRDARTLSLSQEKYISTFVPKFVDDVKSKLMLKTHASPAVASRPDPYHNLYDLSLNKTEVDRVDEPYLAAVASAMYTGALRAS